MYVWSPTCTIWLLWSPNTLYWIGILYGTGIIWSPTCMYGPPTCEVSLCVICLIWSPYFIWNRYHMVPHMCIWFSPMYNMMFMTLKVSNTLYGIGIQWSPLPYMQQLSYGPPKCTYCIIFNYYLLFSMYLSILNTLRHIIHRNRYK